ncbi:MAG: gamma-glutamyltransferase [Bacteroidia bacterium]|nr:gamma-glutamyltransferase [Bacteroidia bacterium]
MKRVFIILAFAAVIFGCSDRPGSKDLPVVKGYSILADHGVVVSFHPESSRIGVEILKIGGNAIDAAVATEFALAVCHPEAGNIGGGGFMLIRTSGGKFDFIDYREKAPLSASRDMFLDSAGNVIEGMSTETQLASGVPGTVDGMIRVHSKYGKLKFGQVIQPAVDLARNGFPVKKDQAKSLNIYKDRFIRKNKNKPAFVKDTEWNEGDTLIQTDLAKTLERIRDYGRDGFYTGKTAELMLAEMKRGNGIISEQDLRDYRAQFRTPVCTDYRGFRIITAPPPSGGGIIVSQVLGMVEPYPVREFGFHTVRSVHLMVEAERRAFADRSEYSADQDFIKVDVKSLIDRQYLKQRFSDFNENRASLSSETGAGNPFGNESSETTHYSVVDKDGNAVSATTTLNGWFGSKIVVDGAGFVLNNEMDDFSVKPGTPNMSGLVASEANVIQPGKRMLSSMTPTIVEKDGKLFMTVGSPGSGMIPTAVLQVIINVLDFDMDLRQAVDTGRFHHQWLPDLLCFEPSALDSLTVDKLIQMGHKLVQYGDIGRVNAIMIIDGGSIAGVADRRGNNSACGY